MAQHDDNGIQPDQWYVAVEDRTVGPVTTELLIRGLENGRVPPEAMVCAVGTSKWDWVATVEPFVETVRRSHPPTAQVQEPASAGRGAESAEDDDDDIETFVHKDNAGSADRVRAPLADEGAEGKDRVPSLYGMDVAFAKAAAAAPHLVGQTPSPAGAAAANQQVLEPGGAAPTPADDNRPSHLSVPLPPLPAALATPARSATPAPAASAPPPPWPPLPTPPPPARPSNPVPEAAAAQAPATGPTAHPSGAPGLPRPPAPVATSRTAPPVRPLSTPPPPLPAPPTPPPPPAAPAAQPATASSAATEQAQGFAGEDSAIDIPVDVDTEFEDLDSIRELDWNEPFVDQLQVARGVSLPNENELIETLAATATEALAAETPMWNLALCIAFGGEQIAAAAARAFYDAVVG
jgi:hypothetical protein